MTGTSLAHLATHAFFSPDDPLDSGIVLADGVLSARELIRHRIRTELLVLSACETGLAGSLGGEEMAGVAQSFLYAGARSLLVGLWPATDRSSDLLIRAFYTARQNAHDTATALRDAAAILRNDRLLSHPHYWIGPDFH